MSALGSGDVTYTMQSQRKEESGNKVFVFSIAFGDGSKTYPSGGVPLLAASLGCPNAIKSFNFVDQGDATGYVYKYDQTNVKIRMYQSAGTVAAHTHTVPAGTDASGGTTGSTTPTAQAVALAEVGTGVAPAAATLYVEVVGW